MQLSALVPIVALLASTTSQASGFSHKHAARLARQEGHNQARKLYEAHERAQAEIASNVERREALAAQFPRAQEKRMVKRAGCKASTSNSTTTSTSSSSSATQTQSSTTQVASTQQASSTQDNSAQSSSSSAAPAASSAPAKTVTVSVGGNIAGKKAGVSGGEGLSAAAGKAAWYYDWNAKPYATQPGMQYIPMMWGIGQSGESQDAGRFADFKSLTPGDWPYVMGVYEPDCLPPMSSNISPTDAANAWLQYFLPHRQAGAQLISPGLCKQKDEDWMQPFLNAIGQNNIWDITALHINKPDMAGVNADLAHYRQYGKPMMVAEFGCIDDQNGFTPCTDQGQVDQFIKDCVSLFESSGDVVGYALTNGAGLTGTVTYTANGALSQAGNTFLSAIASL